MRAKFACKILELCNVSEGWDAVSGSDAISLSFRFRARYWTVARPARPASSQHHRRDMTERQPFAQSLFRRKVARIEFDIFRDGAKDAILAASKEVPGFDVLEKYFSFYITLDDPDTVQAWFGNRSMFRKDLEGKVASESGVHLLYSLGPAGDVVVVLYPSKSSLAKVAEDQLYIGVGRYGGYRLLRRVKSDMRSLVAYGYVSSLDAQFDLERVASDRVAAADQAVTGRRQVRGRRFDADRLFLEGRLSVRASRRIRCRHEASGLRYRGAGAGPLRQDRLDRFLQGEVTGLKAKSCLHRSARPPRFSRSPDCPMGTLVPGS